MVGTDRDRGAGRDVDVEEEEEEEDKESEEEDNKGDNPLAEADVDPSSRRSGRTVGGRTIRLEWDEEEADAGSSDDNTIVLDKRACGEASSVDAVDCENNTFFFCWFLACRFACAAASRTSTLPVKRLELLPRSFHWLVPPSSK